uniref:Uncharacterized protein n=1 Tax=Varanus komodoensis TaxID=61221 RepID=A0A8D2LJI3_VARKO
MQIKLYFYNLFCLCYSKEIPWPNKPSSWTSVPSDCNSLSDSQFLFGSQFCPENSQSASAPLEFSIQQRQGKSSQQNSQDNESSIFAKYQSKPQLFGGDGKEKGSLNFPAGRFKGVLEQFEENKKKIKEKYDKYANTLLESLDQLTVQQNEQHLKLCEQLGYMQLPSLLSEFQTFISAPRVLSHLKDRESQTSPNMLLTQLPSSPHLSLLNIPAGSKVIATISSTPDKENVGTPQRSHIIAGCPDADNVLCTLFANEAAGSHEACWLLTQEPCQATPVRKVIKRDKQVKGRNAVRLSQLNWAHKDSMFMQKHSGDQMNEKLGTDRKKQSKGRGSRIKKREQKLGSQRKKPYSFRKDGNRSRYTNLSMLQNSTGKGSSKSEKSKHSYRNTKNPDNSCLGTMFVNHKKMCCPENKIAEKPKLVFQSHENKQYTPNLQETSGVRKMVDLSSTKNNSSFWACSSPESSLSQNQMRWYSLFDNHSPACSISVQQKCTTYCSLLLDSDSSD